MAAHAETAIRGQNHRCRIYHALGIGRGTWGLSSFAISYTSRRIDFASRIELSDSARKGDSVACPFADFIDQRNSRSAVERLGVQ
jgi:hypothetical protein